MKPGHLTLPLGFPAGWQVREIEAHTAQRGSLVRGVVPNRTDTCGMASVGVGSGGTAAARPWTGDVTPLGPGAWSTGRVVLTPGGATSHYSSRHGEAVNRAASRCREVVSWSMWKRMGSRGISSGTWS